MAKTLSSVGLELPSGMRKTRIVSVLLSATNKSPFGATRSARGLVSPAANSSTVKPSGTIGLAPTGIFIFSGEFEAEGVIIAGGWSASRISRRTPGLSLFQSPNAAPPVRTSVDDSAANPAVARATTIETAASIGNLAMTNLHAPPCDAPIVGKRDVQRRSSTTAKG